MFQDRISRATMKSTFGMSAPSVEVAGLFQESSLHVDEEARATNRNSQELDTLPP